MQRAEWGNVKGAGRTDEVMTMAVRRSELLQPATEWPLALPSAAPPIHLGCQSYLVDGPDGTRIEDEALPGSRRCSEQAMWRVTYSGALTDTGRSALRVKCEDCAESAREVFGPSDVVLRLL